MPTSPKVQAFLEAIAELSKQHGLSLSHEDEGGLFFVEDYDPELTAWLMDAVDQTNDETP